MNKLPVKSCVEFLQRFSQVTHSILKADLFAFEGLGNNYPRILNISHSQTNVKENLTHRISSQYLLQSEGSVPLRIKNSSNVEGKAYSSTSPSGNLRAVLQLAPNKVTPTKNKQILEIYDRDHLLRSLCLDDFHEEIINNVVCGQPFQWNEDETKVLYVASLKPKKKGGFFEEDLDEDKINAGFESNMYKQDYGENLDGIVTAGIFLYDISAHTLSHLLLPKEFLPTYPSFVGKTSEELIFGVFNYPEYCKLGIIHCFNRIASVFHLKNALFKPLYPKSKETDPEKKKAEEEKYKTPAILDFTPLDGDISSFRPLLSPDRKKVLFYSSPLRPAHNNVLSVKVYELESGKLTEIVPIIEENRLQGEYEKEDNIFPGILQYYDEMGKTFWLKDSQHVVFNCFYGAGLSILVLNVNSKQIIRLSPLKRPTDRWRIVDFFKNYDTMVVSEENYENGAPKPILIENFVVPSESDITSLKKNIVVKELTSGLGENKDFDLVRKVIARLEEVRIRHGNAEGFLWRIRDYGRGTKEFDEIFQMQSPEGSELSSDDKKPLVLVIHGGPHGSFSGFAKQRIALLLLGYNLLLPNFSGSGGYGQEFLEANMGKLGQIDSEEIIGMLKQTIEMKLCDPSRVALTGGSYGGYQTAMISGRYPEFFKCGIPLNPVLNIPFMLNISDIPDWCISEPFKRMFKWTDMNADDYKRLFEMSPSAYLSKIPTLLFLGAKDRRVPYQQGLYYHHQLASMGTDIRTYVYPESNHSLADSVTTEFDIYVKTISFLEEMLSDKESKK